MNNSWEIVNQTPIEVVVTINEESKTIIIVPVVEEVSK